MSPESITTGVGSAKNVDTPFGVSSRDYAVWIPGSRFARPGMTKRARPLPPMPEDRGPHADMRGAELDGDGVVGAHAHREIRQPVARGDLGGQREMRRRRLVYRRDAHQAGNLQVVDVAAGRDETVGLAGRDAGLLRLLAGVDLDEKLRVPVLGFDFFG